MLIGVNCICDITLVFDVTIALISINCHNWTLYSCLLSLYNPMPKPKTLPITFQIPHITTLRGVCDDCRRASAQREGAGPTSIDNLQVVIDSSCRTSQRLSCTARLASAQCTAIFRVWFAADLNITGRRSSVSTVYAVLHANTL